MASEQGLRRVHPGQILRDDYAYAPQPQPTERLDGSQMGSDPGPQHVGGGHLPDVSPSNCRFLLLCRLMKIVHFADLHLDAPFAWIGASGAVARRRRQALRDVLVRIVELTREVRADALFCGGDLYEHEHCTPDTAEFLRQTFAELAPVQVYLAPGNHDWYGPYSPYSMVEWSHNVFVFCESRLMPVELSNGVTLWGAAHRAPANTANFLDDFHTVGAGVHLALFHGSERSWLMGQSSGNQPHAPFDVQEIDQAGIHHAFLGHYHRPKDGELHTYPGNPDPLEFGEDGERGAIIATVGTDGSIILQRQRVAISEVHELELDVSGCVSRQEVRGRLAKISAGLSGVARLIITGELDAGIDLRHSDLREAIDVFDAVQVDERNLRTSYDIAAIRNEPTVRGQFVADVLDACLAPDEERRVLMTGLRALEGRNDLEVL